MCNDTNASVQELFNKIYTFKKYHNWSLPLNAFKSPKWFIEEFQTNKHELNSVKGLLNKFDLKEWSNHTRHRDPSTFIIRKLKENVYPELLTQAWCKFYECLCQFPIVPSSCTTKFCSLHLCEAPGAFVCALNHYLTLNYSNIKWNWIANTLNPNYEGNSLSQMIADDRFIKYTPYNWYFGIDHTGDITKYYNHLDLVQKFTNQNISKFDLITADGSVDCMENPGDQERFVEFLHYCETMTALSLLKQGGSFVLKIFTMFEDSTICLLYLLNCLFENVRAFKPCSSKSGNSEIYIISTNYYGFESLENLQQDLITPYETGSFNNAYSMFDLNVIPQTFIDEIRSCSKYFMKKQIEKITENIRFFKNSTEENNGKVHYMKILVSKYYIKKFNLKGISNNNKILPNVDLLRDWRNLENYFEPLNQTSVRCIPTTELITDSNDIHLDVRIGKQIKSINSSKFMTEFDLKFLINCDRPKKSNFYNLISKILENNNFVVDVNQINFKDSYYIFQKCFFDKVRNFCGDTNKNVIFIQVPFFTHFLVGCLYILISAFQFVYYYSSSGFLVLYQSESDRIEKVKTLFQEIERVYTNIEKLEFVGDILEVLPSIIFDKNKKFFEFICYYNHSICKLQ